ncbi:hypothetical protein GCM10025868_41110 [Angustibacter aerolatus]|uniref:Uncharacterized protein n=1 Tax=Angustibacter aerolatus TaxID=1162965 RepID=A0ABQ6JMT3_9ACTN|nr:hypothetical protein GCM10025868_41110 [Angustibacter aerolatus]
MLLCQCSVADWSFYRFTCPGCGESIRKDAPARARRLLMLAGVEPVSWQVPLEALEPHAGEPITFDEVLEFALRLEQVGDPLTEPGGAAHQRRLVDRLTATEAHVVTLARRSR